MFPVFNPFEEKAIIIAVNFVLLLRVVSRDCAKFLRGRETDFYKVTSFVTYHARIIPRGAFQTPMVFQSTTTTHAFRLLFILRRGREVVGLASLSPR